MNVKDISMAELKRRLMPDVSIMYRHLMELQGLYERLEPKHPARQRIRDRIKEARKAIAELEKKS